MVLTNKVFAKPGTPTNKLCPLLNNDIITALTTSCWPTITLPISAERSLYDCAKASTALTSDFESNDMYFNYKWQK